MSISGTERTLTIDANVINYYFRHTKGRSLPAGLRVARLADFCSSVMSSYPIAENDFIRTEYENQWEPEEVRNWLKERLKNELAVHVDCTRLPRDLKKCLRDDYGFDCSSGDAKYLQTCLNTGFKRLVTENTQHFCRRHRTSGRRNMRRYLRKTRGLAILRIDECCCDLLEP